MKAIKLSLIAVIAISTSLTAQKKNVSDAIKKIENAEKMAAIKNFSSAKADLQEAKTLIDAATQDPSTADKYDTWYYKALVYGKMQEIPELESQNPFLVSHEAIMKAHQLDAKKTMAKDEFKSILANNAFNFYNAGVNEMNKQQYKNAQASFENAYNIFQFDAGKIFKDNKQVDTLSAKANLLSGYSAYYADNADVAISKLKTALSNPINASESNIYLILSQAYGKNKNTAEQLATINDGKKKFPNDANIIAAEINYYIDNNKSEELIKRLNDEIAKNPNKDDYYYNLAFAHQSIANNNEGKPEEEINWNKASEYFKKAYELKSDNTDYAFNTGVSFFNRGKIINDKMLKLGNTNEDIKKFDELKKQRDNLFTQAEPYFVKAITIYKSQNKSSLTPAQMNQFENTYKALGQVYANLNMTDKYNANKKELDEL